MCWPLYRNTKAPSTRMKDVSGGWKEQQTCLESLEYFRLGWPFILIKMRGQPVNMDKSIILSRERWLFCGWAAAAAWRSCQKLAEMSSGSHLLWDKDRKRQRGKLQDVFKERTPCQPIRSQRHFTSNALLLIYRLGLERAVLVCPPQLQLDITGTAATCAGSSCDESQQHGNDGKLRWDSKCKWAASTAVRVAVGTAKQKSNCT